jgi:SAM-dependent methyltransferase
MSTQDLDAKYWENRYQNEDTGWDLGRISPPLKAYFDQISNKNLSILIPGCGRAYEAEYLFKQGFNNVFPADIADSAKTEFLKRVPNFPEEKWISTEFFEINHKYDLIIEQTFFCAIDPKFREKYAKKMFDLIRPGGKLVGLLFTEVPNSEGPPFGGNSKEYQEIFSKYFKNIQLENCYNSIPPRAGRELFMIIKKEN